MNPLLCPWPQNIPILSVRAEKNLSLKCVAASPAAFKRKSIICSRIYKGLVIEDFATSELYQITQILSDSHTELDSRVPVLTGEVKAIYQCTRVT